MTLIDSSSEKIKTSYATCMIANFICCLKYQSIVLRDGNMIDNDISMSYHFFLEINISTICYNAIFNVFQKQRQFLVKMVMKRMGTQILILRTKKTMSNVFPKNPELQIQVKQICNLLHTDSKCNLKNVLIKM